MSYTEIRITEDGLPTIRFVCNGNIEEKTVTFDQLINALGQYGRENLVVETPTLPKGTVHFRKTTKGEVIVLEVDSVVVDVKFEKAVVESVHFPRLLFAFTVQDNNVGRCQIVAVKDREITETTKLFQYPFSNVDSSTKACWSELPVSLDKLTDLSRVPYRWFGSENTFCYYGKNNLSGLDYRAYLVHNSAENRTEFDYDTLKPLNMTFADWTMKP